MYASTLRHAALQAGTATSEASVQITTSGVESRQVWPGLGAHLQELASRVQLVLRSNTLLGACPELGSGSGGAGADAKTQVLQEQYALTELVFGKDKVISGAQWHPQRRAVVTASFRECLGQATDEGAASSCNILAFWNLTEAMKPERMLFSLHPPQCFHICPSMPHLVVAGCTNGTILVWDLSVTTTGEDKEGGKMGRMSPTSQSALEQSHRTPVLGVAWLPGLALAGTKFADAGDQHCTLFVSVSSDGKVMIWDLLALPSRINLHRSKDDVDEDEAVLQPILKLQALVNNVAALVSSVTIQIADESFQVLLGCNEGKLAVLEKGSIESSAAGACPCQVSQLEALGSLKEVAPSPALPGMLLVVSEWGFAICFWSGTGLQQLLLFPPPPVQYTSGSWSPTRPGVVYLARRDGGLEAWDLMESTQQATAVVTVSGAALTYIEAGPSAAFATPGSKSWLGIGCENGLLHVLEVPRKLRKGIPGEAKRVMEILKLS